MKCIIFSKTSFKLASLATALLLSGCGLSIG